MQTDGLAARKRLLASPTTVVACQLMDQNMSLVLPRTMKFPHILTADLWAGSLCNLEIQKSDSLEQVPYCN